MLTFTRTNSDNIDFIELSNLLDLELRIRDGADHAFYAQFNKIANIKEVMVAYENDIPVACGAFKIYDAGIAEIKRMYVIEAYRKKGIATQILAKLEKWAKECAYHTCILETGIKQPEAIALYYKNNYQKIPNYGQYANVETSYCFEKLL